jgi:hypothetical protein
MDFPGIAVCLASLLALFAFSAAWHLNLKMRELPGALAAVLAGAGPPRRLGRIIIAREEAKRPRARLQPLRQPGVQFPVASRQDLLRAYRQAHAAGRPHVQPDAHWSRYADLEALGTQLRAHESRILQAYGVPPASVLSGSGSVTAAELAGKRLAVPGEPACDDPECTGCRALAARRRHEDAR